MSQSGKAPPLMRFGIAGLGVGGNNALKDVPGLAAHPAVKLTAAADLRPYALEQFAQQFGGETYSSVEAMCESSNLDAVYVLTPNRFHAEHAIIAAEHGKQVILDKPMALTLEDCDAVIHAAERNGVRVLVGHSQSLDAPILKMAELVQSGAFGRLLTITQLNYTSWLYSPRSREEMDPICGEGIVMRQAPIQVDIARLIGGGLVSSVRAMSTAADPARPVEGSYLAYLEFAAGGAASLNFSGYAHFQTADMTREPGAASLPSGSGPSAEAHRLIRGFSSTADEWAYKDSERYGGQNARGVTEHRGGRQPVWGFSLVSCEKADLRPSPDGVLIYGDDGTRLVTFPAAHYAERELDEMVRAWREDAPLRYHDARWGKATTEVCLGIIESARLRQEVTMSHQTALPSGNATNAANR